VLEAQDVGADTQLAAAEGRGPRFFYAVPAGGQARIDARNAAVLKRRVSVHFTHVALAAALDEIARQAGLNITYSRDVIPADASASVNADGLTVAAALTELLIDQPLDVVLSPSGNVALVRREPAPGPPGTVIGKVTDVKTGQALSGAEVFVEGKRWRAMSTEDGSYRLAEVDSGSYTVVARRIGYAKASLAVRVEGGKDVSVDFALEPVPTQLDEIVSTATGDQRVRELGHVVARINADSLVKEAPVSDLSELLQSRVPGLQVLTGSGGVVGGAVTLQLRGLTSTSLSSQPIVFVDGVRYKSDNQVVGQGGFTPMDDQYGQGELRSPLNDINVNDIETIEVVKGPSASTLYGPDAANGVIVITTKRGKPGKTQFNWYLRPVSNSVPKKQLPTKGFRVWGHDPTTGVNVNGNCSVIQQYYYQTCVQDSITVAETGFGRPDLSIIAKSRPTWLYGASVAGGTPVVRYFFSGNYSSQVGSIQLPDALEASLRDQVGAAAVDDAIREPNALRTVGVRTNLSADVLRHGSVTFSADYSQTTQRRTDVSGFFQQMLYVGAGAPGVDTSDATQFLYPRGLLNRTEDRTNRLTASLSGSFAPIPWLTLNASAGIDLDAVVTHSGAAANLLAQGDGGRADDVRRNSQNRTFTLGATAMARPGRWSFRSSVGGQYTYQRLDGVNTTGFGLAPGSTSIGTATSTFSFPVWSEVASLGTYGEEVIGFNDRVFLTGSLRFDGSTSFGDSYKPRPYPKVGFSWLASDEPFLRDVPIISDLRFRVSYGAASRYPTSAMKLGVVSSAPTFQDGNQTTIFTRNTLANPELQPERSREWEGGADVTLFSRINVGLTWFQRRTDDLLEQVLNPMGLVPQWDNVASIKAHGFEATAHATILDRRAIRADLTFNYALGRTRVLSVGNGREYLSSRGSYAVGYPLGAAFGRPLLGVADTAGGVADGLIFPNEVIRSSTQQFLGVTIPPRTLTLTPTAAFLDGHLRVSAVFDRQTGFVLYDFYRSTCVITATCLGPYLTSTPLLEQASYASGSTEDFLEPGDFTRWREMTITVDLPRRWLRFVHMSTGSVSLQGRNLALWTDHSSVDPESRSENGLLLPGYGTVPQAGGWSIRFDVQP
jgi:TonB-linked SusC/RagA family outer membrane protein